MGCFPTLFVYAFLLFIEKEDNNTNQQKYQRVQNGWSEKNVICWLKFTMQLLTSN